MKYRIFAMAALVCFCQAVCAGERVDPCDEAHNTWLIRREARKRDAPAIDWLEGWYVADGGGTGRPNALHIGGSEVVRNGYAEDMFPVLLAEENVSLHRSGEPDYRIARLRLDGDTLHATYLEDELAYNKVDEAEYEKVLKESRFEPDKLLGFWVSERIERDAYPFPTLVVYKGQEGEWPVVMIGSGLTLNFGAPAIVLIYGIFDMTPSGGVLLRGGLDFEHVILEIMLENDVMELRDCHDGTQFVFRRSDEEGLRRAQAIRE